MILRFPMERIRRRAAGAWASMDDLPDVQHTHWFDEELARHIATCSNDDCKHPRTGTQASSGSQAIDPPRKALEQSPTTGAVRGTAVPCDDKERLT